MSKRNPPPIHGERFDALLRNIAAATGNDAEIEVLRDVVEVLWQLLTPEQVTELFTNCGAIETKAARWAGTNAPAPARSQRPGRCA